MTWILVALLVVAAVAVLLPRVVTPSFSGARMATCPASPNCVSSRAEDAGHRIEAWVFEGDAATAQSRVRAALAALPRTRIVEDEPGYLRAECRSFVFGFVDDVELEIGPGRIHVRSASRLGHSDLGVNSRRVAVLRVAFESRIR